MGLKDRVPDLPAAVKVVLEKAISANLQTYQIKALVEWLVAGKAVEDFDPTQVKKPTKWDNRKTDTDDEGDGEESPEEEETEELKTSPKLKKKTKKTSKAASPGSSGFLEEFLAGVSVTKPALKKARKGEPLTGGEWFLLGFHIVIEGAKKFGKWIKPGIHEVFRWYHGFFKKLANFIVPHPSSHSSGSRKSKSGHLSQGHQPQKLGKGSSANLDKPLQALAHWMVYVFLQLFFWDRLLGLIPSLKPWLEWPVRWLAHEGLVVFPAIAWAYAQSHLVPAIFIGVLLALALAAAYVKKPAQTLALIAVLGLAWFYGRTWSDNLKLPNFFKKSTGSESTMAVTPPSTTEPSTVVKVEKHLSKPSSLQPQVDGHALNVPVPETGTGASQQAPTAFNGDDNGKTLLEQAISTITNNVYVKSLPVIPDSSIGQLMAVNRVGDIAVESEYSLRVGQGGEKIISVTPSATGLTIAIEGGLPLGGLLGGGSALGFYWEDVQTIYCIELDTPSGKTSVLRPQAEGQDLSVPIPQKGIGIYYFVLTATNLPQPLVVRCNTTNNLNHLVSAFEYFIKAAQGKYVPVTGMPYLNQGMVLGDQGKIMALWANSPADQAGLTFVDHVWSVQGNQEQKGAALESALQALPSGKQTINVVTPADWQTAAAKENQAHNGVFQPKLTAMEIVVP